MSIYSARKMLSSIERQSGYCLPLALDSVMPNAELPREVYDFAFDDYNSQAPSYNRTISFILTEFFRTQPEPSTDTAAIAKFNAFGSSPQTYMPEISSDVYQERLESMNKFGVTDKQMRLQELLAAASKQGCNVLFSNFHSKGEHVSGLEVIDPGEDEYDTSYVIRNWGKLITNRIYSGADLSGINQLLGSPIDEFTPLPERTRAVFPKGETSWELIILPPEPS